MILRCQGLPVLHVNIHDVKRRTRDVRILTVVISRDPRNGRDSARRRPMLMRLGRLIVCWSEWRCKELSYLNFHSSPTRQHAIRKAFDVCSEWKLVCVCHRLGINVKLTGAGIHPAEELSVRGPASALPNFSCSRKCLSVGETLNVDILVFGKYYLRWTSEMVCPETLKVVQSPPQEMSPLSSIRRMRGNFMSYQMSTATTFIGSRMRWTFCREGFNLGAWELTQERGTTSACRSRLSAKAVSGKPYHTNEAISSQHRYKEHFRVLNDDLVLTWNEVNQRTLTI